MNMQRLKIKGALQDFDFASDYAALIKSLLRGEVVELAFAELALMVLNMHVRERMNELEREARIANTLMRDSVQWHPVSDDECD
jgi:hypothetical protein